MKTYKPVRNLPRCVRVAFSSVEDGPVSPGGGKSPTFEHEKNVEKFLVKYGFQQGVRTRVRVTYLPENTYSHIERVISANKGQAIKADALFTTDTDCLITLPVADCIATIIYDPKAGMLAVLHLGRHSSVAGLIEEFAIRVADELGSDPHDWHVWMSPSLKPDHDRMEYFTPPNPENWEAWQRQGSDGMIHIDIPGHNRERFERLGVPQANIYVSPINTYNDERFYSHRAAVELNRPDREGRMMVAAVMTDR